uniref:Uncharacterized protein n=1 Tax=Paramoeba aestuarina TaxID=180227 RepID=A0A7S4JYX3_9EUKA
MELQYLVAIMGGHPRSLSFLFNEVSSKEKRNASVIDTLEAVWESFSAFMMSTDFNWETVLKHALQGDEIRAQDVLDGCKVMTLLQRSVLLNDVDPKIAFRPHLPLLPLRHWCKNKGQGNRWLKVCLRHLIDAGLTLDYRTFEHFIHDFERLRGWALSDQPVSLSNFLKGAVCVLGNSNQTITVPIPNENNEMRKQLPTKLGDLIEDISPGHYLPAQNQPAFDSFVVTEGVVVFFECRFSELGASTTLSPHDDVYEKVALLRQQIQACHVQFGNETLSEENCVFVLVTRRDVPKGDFDEFVKAVKKGPSKPEQRARKTAAKEETEEETQKREEKQRKKEENKKKRKANWDSYSEFKGTVFLMDKSGLETHLGPTFAQLGGFVLSNPSKTEVMVTSGTGESS